MDLLAAAVSPSHASTATVDPGGRIVVDVAERREALQGSIGQPIAGRVSRSRIV